MSEERTPIGARPRWILEEWRIIELYDAIIRRREWESKPRNEEQAAVEELKYAAHQNMQLKEQGNIIEEWKEELFELMRKRFDEPDGVDWDYRSETYKWGWTACKVWEIKEKYKAASNEQEA